MAGRPRFALYRSVKRRLARMFEACLKGDSRPICNGVSAGAFAGRVTSLRHRGAGLRHGMELDSFRRAVSTSDRRPAPQSSAPKGGSEFGNGWTETPPRITAARAPRGVFGSGLLASPRRTPLEKVHLLLGGLPAAPPASMHRAADHPKHLQILQRGSRHEHPVRVRIRLRRR